MRERRLSPPIRTRIIVRLDQFLSWPPFVQIPVIVVLTVLLVMVFGLAYAAVSDSSTGDSLWFALTRFLDGGVMADDAGGARRTIAVGITVTGVLLVSFLTGAFASKLGERIDDLRSGSSPIIARDHILILGFDPKVSLIVRELARSTARLGVVVLAREEKERMDAQLRFAHEMKTSHLKLTCRTGDPQSEVSLLRVCAERAKTIVLTSPSHLDDEHALRYLVSVLLAVRRAIGKRFEGRVVVESRRAIHAPLITLTGEAGLAGDHAVPIDVYASDDVLARVLAQSVREAGVYFALRELLSFRGSEVYLEPLPHALVGKSFNEAHGRITDGIAIGVFRADGSYRICPPEGTFLELAPTDQLLVLEENRDAFSLGPLIPILPSVSSRPLERVEPKRVIVIGANRTLPRLITELDRLMAEGSVVELCRPGSERPLAPLETTRNVRVIERRIANDGAAWDDPSIYEADAVVVLGCEEDEDPEADASAISLMLQLRHAQRLSNRFVKRLITEVRDPIIARQIANSPDDFLVSNDVVAMLLAQAAMDSRMAPIYRELLDPTGVEVFLIPREVYSADPHARFADILAAARERGEVAIGFFPQVRGEREIEERNPVWINPPRDAQVPNGPDAAIVILADP